MGKMKLKLSHVMPHAWFYKLREVGKPGGAKHFKAADPARSNRLFGSTVNHKAMDIPFPAETVKRSPYIQHVPEEAAGVECQPAVAFPYVLVPENTVSLFLEEGDSERMSPVPDSNGGVNFDVRELEKRLKALATEDGRRYLSSPMLLSAALSSPSPIRNRGALHTQCRKGLNQAASDSWDRCSGNSGACISDRFHLDMLDKCGGPRMSPLLNVSHPRNGDRQLSESCASNAGGRHSIGSTDDSNRHSTSSSDTGLERASSSIWEKDVFSVTSDGSEAFAMTYPESADLVLKAPLRRWRARENMRCKEFLLSSQMPTGQGAVEEKSLSNYAKFKLRQRTLLQNKLNASDGSMQCDLGHSDTALRGDEHPHSDGNIATISAHSNSNPSRLDYGIYSECVSSHRPTTSPYHPASPRELKNNKRITQDKGPSGLLGALKLTREEPINLSLKHFSPSASAGGTCSTASQSRVFDSFAMVKFSYDPSHDFKESMVEMVSEKGLRSSHDMVELLQCYLTLNADVYHDTIVNVFTEVWWEMFQQNMLLHHS